MFICMDICMDIHLYLGIHIYEFPHSPRLAFCIDVFGY